MPRSSAKKTFLANAAMNGPLSSAVQSFLRPQIGGQAGELQPVVLHFFLERVAFGLGVAGIGTGMRVEAAQFDAFVAEVVQLVQDLVEIVGRLLLVEEVRPAADGEFLLHGDLLLGSVCRSAETEVVRRYAVSG